MTRFGSRARVKTGMAVGPAFPRGKPFLQLLYDGVVAEVPAGKTQLGWASRTDSWRDTSLGVDN